MPEQQMDASALRAAVEGAHRHLSRACVNGALRLQDTAAAIAIFLRAAPITEIGVDYGGRRRISRGDHAREDLAREVERLPAQDGGEMPSADVLRTALDIVRAQQQRHANELRQADAALAKAENEITAARATIAGVLTDAG